MKNNIQNYKFVLGPEPTVEVPTEKLTRLGRFLKNFPRETNSSKDEVYIVTGTSMPKIKYNED